MAKRDVKGLRKVVSKGREYWYAWREPGAKTYGSGVWVWSSGHKCRTHQQASLWLCGHVCGRGSP